MASEKKENFLRKYRDEKTQGVRTLTASEFLEVVKHYDQDGNGYIEGKELVAFLREVGCSVNATNANETVTEAVLEQFKEAFLDAYDTNADGRISIRELADLLPVDENFMFIFQNEKLVENANDFIDIWKAIDTDKSGFIEAKEVSEFLTRMFSAKGNTTTKVVPTPAKIEEYTKTLLAMYDDNGDGKLQLSEMIQLLPSNENEQLKNLIKDKTPVTDEINAQIFASYDYSKDGVIDGPELNDFVKDAIDVVEKDYTLEQFEAFKAGLVNQTVSKQPALEPKDMKAILVALTIPK
jgi:Ca2+-binding EF-hand superfamily protein